MDRLSRAVIARFTQGIAPHAFFDAWFDWASHLAFAPGRLLELGLEAIEAGAQLTRFVTRATSNEVESRRPSRRSQAITVSPTLLGKSRLIPGGSRAFSRRRRGGRAQREKCVA